MTRARLSCNAAALTALALLLAIAAQAAGPQFPPLTGRVVDDANILTAQTRAQVTSMLAQHERATGQQVVVVTLPSLQGYTIEDFGYQLGRYWGIGQKGKNTGALLIVAPHERKVRIEVGYGLEGQLTDAQSRVIIDQQILPAFKQGDYNTGVLAGTQAVLATLGGAPARAAPAAAPAPSAFEAPWIIPLLFGGWMLFLYLRSRFTSQRRGFYRSRGPVLIPGAYPPIGRYPSGGWGGGGFGGGGFSGGGGSFGGGGASGGW